MLHSLRIFTASIDQPPSSGRTDEAIRGEIYSAEPLELHAESFAARQPVCESYWGWYDLAAEARWNGTILLACHSPSRKPLMSVDDHANLSSFRR